MSQSNGKPIVSKVLFYVTGTTSLYFATLLKMQNFIHGNNLRQGQKNFTWARRKTKHTRGNSNTYRYD